MEVNVSDREWNEVVASCVELSSHRSKHLSIKNHRNALLIFITSHTRHDSVFNLIVTVIWKWLKFYCAFSDFSFLEPLKKLPGSPRLYWKREAYDSKQYEL